MNKLYQPEDVASYNARSLKTLARAIAFTRGRFSLTLVRCNDRGLQQQMLQQLPEQYSVEIRSLVLPESAKTLYKTIQSELKDENPPALMILGLETVTALDDLLASTNQVRNDFPKSFQFPLVLWVNDEVLKKLIKLAPDFKNWAGVPIPFVVATDESKVVSFISLPTSAVTEA